MLMRIGARIPLLAEATRCACGRSRPLHEAGKIAWDCGDHHSACAARGAGDLAHNTVNAHGLAQMARAAHIPTRIEVRGGYGHMANTAAGGSRSRPDLVLYGFPNMGTKTTVDLTLTTVVSGLNAGESTTHGCGGQDHCALSRSSGGGQAGQLRTPPPRALRRSLPRPRV